MANIMFKRGAQASLPTSAQDGVFYLTTDTNRLYVGQGTSMTLLNQQVHVVASTNDIPQYPEVNDFYYCTSENILAFYNGNEWKQINPDTNDTIKVVSVGTKTEKTDNNTSITHNFTLKQDKYDKNNKKVASLPDVTFAVKLTKEDLEAIIHDPANVGLKVTSGTNAATVATQGIGANTSQTVTVKGSPNVTVSASDSEITIAAKDSQYTLSSLDNSGAATVRLTGNDDAGAKKNDVVFKAGKDLTVAADTTGVTYAHATVSTTADTATKADGLTHNGTFDVVTGVTTDNGHVTKVTTKKYQLPTDIHIKQVNDLGNWKDEIEETNGGKFTIDFSSEAKALEDDLREEISKQLAAVNTALTYKGTISIYSALATKTNVEIGDVYLLSAKDGNYKLGDMFIATVKDGGSHTGGVIKAGDVKWEHVPSGDELNTDTLFKGDVTVTTGGENTGKIEYAWSAVLGADDDDGKTPVMPSGHEDLTIKAGKDIVVGASGTEATIGHKEYAAVTPDNSAAASAASFTAVTGVTLSNGHVTGVDTQTYTPDTYTLAGTSNQIQLKKGTGALVEAIDVKGDSWINASVTGDKLTLTHAAPQTGTTKSVTNTAPLVHGGKLKILTGVTYDENGHVSNVATGEVTLPADNNTTYDMFVGNAANASASVTSSTADPYVVLRPNGGQNDTIQLKGDSGSLAVNGTSGAVTISMVWGSFDD